MGKQKPRGYWHSWENVERELHAAAEKLGHFPNARELIAMKLSGLSTAIVSRYGGFVKVRTQLGYGGGRKPRGYFQKWENVERDLILVIAAIGRFPTSLDLRDLDQSTLAFAIDGYHGGFSAVRKRMGFEQIEKPKGYWKEWEHVESALLEAVDALEHFPSQAELFDLDRSDLSTAIGAYHGGLSEVRSRMGYELLQRPKGYWKKWENVESELRAVMDQLGHYPSNNELRDLGHNSLAHAIHKYHNGKAAVRERLNIRPVNRRTLVEYMALITKAYMSSAGSNDAFEDFLSEILETCRFEVDLLDFLKDKQKAA